MTWIKVKNPETNEIRSFINTVFDYSIYDNIKSYTKVLFQLDDDFDFYFHLLNQDKDKIVIKESYELLDYIQKLSYTCLILEIVPLNNLKLEKLSLNENINDNQLYKSLLPKPTLSETPQFDVICDGCFTPIRGQRNHCETCGDFDLCSICKYRVNHNPNHIIQSINITENKLNLNSSENLSLSQNNQFNENSIHSSKAVYLCDNCDHDIIGIRHTCDSCPDFDLCHSCFSIVKQSHPTQHNFSTHLAGVQPTNQNNKQENNIQCNTSCDQNKLVEHNGIQCDHCHNEIKGIRYKCGHCRDFDLCEFCEESAETIHDKTHVFIKLRYPVTSFKKRNRPLLPNFDSPDISSISSFNSSKSDLSSSYRAENEDSYSEQDDLDSFENHQSTSTRSMVDATFIADVNLPEGTIVSPKQSIIKVWEVKNTGNLEWPIGCYLLLDRQSNLDHPSYRFSIPMVSPNEETFVTVDFIAPETPGHYASCFNFYTPEGKRFGDRLWCVITVAEDNQSTNLPKTPLILPSPRTQFDDSEYDTYSTTGDVSNTTVTYTNSQVSTLSPDNLSDHFETSTQDNDSNNEYEILDAQLLQLHNQLMSNNIAFSSINHSSSISHSSATNNSSVNHSSLVSHSSTTNSSSVNHSFLINHSSSIDSSSLIDHPSAVDHPSLIKHSSLADQSRKVDEPSMVNHSSLMDQSSLLDRPSSVDYPPLKYHTPSVHTSSCKVSETKADTESIVDSDDDFVIVNDTEDEISIPDSSGTSSIHSTHTITEASTNTVVPLDENQDFRSELDQLQEMGFTSSDNVDTQLFEIYSAEAERSNPLSLPD